MDHVAEGHRPIWFWVGGIGGLVALFLVFLVARSLGATGFVGYERNAAAAHGFFNAMRLPIGFSIPLYLREGDTVRADYDATVIAGAVNVQLLGFVQGGTLHALPPRTIAASGTGTIELSVDRSGFYWPRAHIAMAPAIPCRERRAGDGVLTTANLPGVSCPAPSLEYSIWWTAR